MQICVAVNASPTSHQTSNVEKVAGEGDELIGKIAPEFASMQWVDGKARTLKELRGHLVLIRLWNRHCGMCKDTAPLLNDLYKKYSIRGLVILGVHHKKTAKPDTIDEVKAQAAAWHMSFPIAVDNEWKTVKRMWMYKERPMTSATILIGTDGRILWVHPGGTIESNSQAAKQLDAAIESALR